MEPILTARGLVKRYGKVTALDHCDFDLMPGEILAVIGDNGAGKSSLIKAISGAVIPDAGTIELEGKKIQFESPIEAREAGIDVSDTALAAADLSKLDHAAEIEVAKKIAEWPRLVETAARGHEPHRVAFYLYELASDLHGLWNRGNDEPGLRFLQDDPATSAAKIALARAVGVVICAGLGILGVTPVEEMR